VVGVELELYATAVSERVQWHVVRLDAGDGLFGLGECSDSRGSLGSVIGELGLIARHLGEFDCATADPDRVAKWAAGALATMSATRLSRTVLGGVEQAVCDLAARAQDLPLWRWLGGEGTDSAVPVPAVPCYANINRTPGGRTPADVARAAKAAASAGFSAVKCAPFDVPDGRVPLTTIGLDRAAAVRGAVGDEVELLVDCHERLDMRELEHVLPALHDLRVSWLEDAVDVEDVAKLRYLRGLTDVTIAGGELAHCAASLLPAVRDGLVDVIMPDVKHAGGVTRALALASSFPGIKVSPHNPSGPVATVVSAHLFHVLPHATVLEVAYGDAQWRPSVLRPLERTDQGQLAVPSGPGLAIDLDVHHPSTRLVWSTTP
jgi:galactonate dehydratase